MPLTGKSTLATFLKQCIGWHEEKTKVDKNKILLLSTESLLTLLKKHFTAKQEPILYSNDYKFSSLTR